MGSVFPITTAAKTILTGMALLLLSACASVPVTPEADKRIGSAQILSICEKLAKSNDTRIAIGLCEKAHTEDPENPVPLLILGDMLQQQGALAQAGRAYGMAIDLDPENVEAHYGLGKVFLARNQYELATEQFEVARELNARDHRLYNALGVVLDNLGDHVSAQEHYRVGLELAPNNRALKKNLTLSRSLDDSVTSPAIGPRFEVVPAPASTPGETQNGGGGPALLPPMSPQQRQDPSAPAGVLGHEPLAYAPTIPPQKNPYLPGSKAVVAQASSRQFSVTDNHSDTVSRQTVAHAAGSGEFRESAQAYRSKSAVTDLTTEAQKDLGAAIRVTQSGTIHPVPTDEEKAVAADSSSLAYFPIVAPTQSQPADAVQPVQSQIAKRTLAASPAVRQDDRHYIQPVLNSVHLTVAPTPGVESHVDSSGPRILASSGMRDLVVSSETLEDAPAARPAQMAALPKNNLELQKTLREAQTRATSSILPLVPTTVAESFTAETSASALLPDLESAEAPERRVLLNLAANDFGAEKVTLGRAAALPSADVRLPKVPQHRFGREHEGDHETRHIEGEFWDLVDVVNPMQHIPIIASIYRDVTEDEIRPAAKIAGGTLFGGVLGFASSIFDSVVEEVSGQDMTQTAVTALSRGTPEDDRDTTLIQQERIAAWRQQQSRR